MKNIKKRRQNEILDAALKVFPIKGYDATTLDSIARVAGFSKGTLYLYFKNKKELYISMVEREFENVLRILDEIINRKKSVVDRLKELICEEISYIERRREFYQLSSIARGGFRTRRIPEIKKRIYPIYERMLNKIEKLIGEGIKSGELKKLDKRVVAVSLIGMLHSTAISWLVESKKFPLKKKSEEIVKILLDGIKK